MTEQSVYEKPTVKLAEVMRTGHWLLYVQDPKRNATYALIVRDSRVISCPPIAKWFQGKMASVMMARLMLDHALVHATLLGAQ